MSQVNEVRAAHLKTWADSWVQTEALPGIMMGIYGENGEELFFHAVDNVKNGSQKYTKDALFRIYSMTKPITTVAFLILVERGIISVEDEVSKWIPAFADAKVCIGGTAEDPVTEPLAETLRIVHLLTHTSGISYGFFGNNISDQIIRKKLDPDWQQWFHHTPLETLCQAIAETPLCFQPGTKYHYGLSTDVLGRIVEVASQKPLDEFFQENIFNPLQMRDTYFQVPESEAYRLVEIHEIAPGQTYKLSTNAERDRLAKRVLLAGGGGLVSTIVDYSKFATFLLRGGTSTDGVRLLSTESVNAMRGNSLAGNADLAAFSFEKGFSESLGPGYGFGYNVSIVMDPAGVRGGKLSPPGEYGWGGVAGTTFAIDVVNKRTSIFFTQLVGGAMAYPIRPPFRWLSHLIFEEEEK